MMSLCPLHICTCGRKIICEHCSQRCHLHASAADIKPVLIHRTEARILIEERTWRISINEKTIRKDYLLMAAKTTARADIFPLHNVKDAEEDTDGKHSTIETEAFPLLHTSKSAGSFLPNERLSISNPVMERCLREP